MHPCSGQPNKPQAPDPDAVPGKRDSLFYVIDIGSTGSRERFVGILVTSRSSCPTPPFRCSSATLCQKWREISCRSPCTRRPLLLLPSPPLSPLLPLLELRSPPDLLLPSRFTNELPSRRTALPICPPLACRTGSFGGSNSSGGVPPAAATAEDEEAAGSPTAVR